MSNSTNRKRIGCLGWSVRILGGLIVFVILLLLAGTILQKTSTAADWEEFPPPGERVDVDGYALHIDCVGEGSPTVVVDTGNGDWSLSWRAVQAAVAETTRICTYDRAGYGWSDAGPQPRSAGQIVDELHALLSAAAIPGPYVLVGHSMGGYTVRLYADRYPDEVAGMVLVDAGHEEQATRMPAAYQQIDQQFNGYLQVMGLMSRLGVLRMLGAITSPEALSPGLTSLLPAKDRPAYMAFLSHPVYFATSLAERQALPETFAQLQATGDLGDVPLVVLTAGRVVDASAMPGGLPPDMPVDEMQQVWGELQNELAALSTNSTHLVVDSPHAIHLYQPQVVVDAILQVVESSD